MVGERVDERRTERDAAFEDFVAAAEPRLRRALVAAYGAQVGREATVDALAYGWEHFDRVSAMANPVGYLYRVGESSARRQLGRRGRGVEPGVPSAAADVEPGLVDALRGLSEQQRAAVVLVHGYGYSLREAAATLEISMSTVRNHLDRGMARLRKQLEARDD